MNYVKAGLTKTVIARFFFGGFRGVGPNLKSGHKIGGKPNAISPRLLRSFPHRGPLIRLGWPFLSWIHTKRVNNKTETCVLPTKNIKFQTKILFGHLSNEVNCFPH